MSLDCTPASRRRRGWARVGASIAASLAAHVVVLAVLVVAARAPPPARPVPFAVELIELPGPPRATAVPAPPGAMKADRRRAAGARTQGPAASAAAPRTAGPGAGSDEGVAAAPGARPAPDLRPRLSVVAPPPGPGPKPGDPGDGLQRSLSELAGRARVESGLAHPYHSQLASALSRSWHVEDTIEARGASGYLADVRESLQTFVRVWAKLADGYGTTGAPALVDGGSDRLRELAGLPPGPARDALARTEVNRQLARVWSEGHVATVRVVQDRDGRLKSARLVAPSIDPELDREALAAVPAAVAQLAAPAEVLGGREELATLWEFEIEVSITPPVPVVGVEFDEALGHVDLRLPLDRRIWKRVRLVAIE